MTENKNILVIGLGSMGYGIAKSLMRTGYQVYGQDKNPDQQKKFFQDGGFEGKVPYDQLEAVVIVVLNEKQTREIIFGEEGISNKLKNNTLIMVCTTVSPDFAKEMDNKCAKKGLLYLDAPISGGSKKSLEGKLSYMISGSQKALQKAKPILDSTSEKVFKFGQSVGAGSAMKAVNQMLAGIHISAMAEANKYMAKRSRDCSGYSKKIKFFCTSNCNSHATISCSCWYWFGARR